ncbi:MAG TPA: hypothetical protein VL098_08270 [Flavipsychrobacter sp.]|nr:hypothetical protein [Flavipsychrobacter sp.]
MDRNKVVLVDLNDNAIGEMDKIEAHQKGVLHRAFSIFLFNTCCSHPQWDDDIKESAQERLQYETGMYCYLNKSFSFIYHTPVENNLIEHEYDHVFVGYTDIRLVTGAGATATRHFYVLVQIYSPKSILYTVWKMEY